MDKVVKNVKRGRPRKDIKDVLEAENVPVGKKRGRPRKEFAIVESSILNKNELNLNARSGKVIGYCSCGHYLSTLDLADGKYFCIKCGKDVIECKVLKEKPLSGEGAEYKPKSKKEYLEDVMHVGENSIPMNPIGTMGKDELESILPSIVSVSSITSIPDVINVDDLGISGKDE